MRNASPLWQKSVISQEACLVDIWVVVTILCLHSVGAEQDGCLRWAVHVIAQNGLLDLQEEHPLWKRVRGNFWLSYKRNSLIYYLHVQYYRSYCTLCYCRINSAGDFCILILQWREKVKASLGLCTAFHMGLKGNCVQPHLQVAVKVIHSSEA